jgi:hypothetical protein
MIVNKDDSFVKIIHFRQSFNVHFRLKMAQFTLLTDVTQKSIFDTPPTPLAFATRSRTEGSIAARVEFIKSPLGVRKRVGERGRREASGVCLLSGGTLNSRIIQNA